MMRALRDLEVKRLVLAVLLVPLLVMSFFSVHTMPRFTDEGMQIVICTADGFETVSVSDEDEPDRKPQSLCDWAMQIHAAALPAPGPAADAVPLARQQAEAFESVILRSGRIDSGKQARAPPLSV